MKKRNSKMLLSLLIGAVFVLLTYSAALAAGDCSNGQKTCWNFASGYEIQVVDQGVLVDGLERWVYSVKKSPSLKGANFIALGLDAGIKNIIFDTSKGFLGEVCEGESTFQIGIGDCLRQYLKYTPNFDSSMGYIVFWIEPTHGKKSPMPIAMKGSSTQENGEILGPVADTSPELETIFNITEGKEGQALAVSMDRELNLLKAWSCDANCGNYPTNFTPVDLDQNSFSLGEQYYCVTATTAFPANTTFILNGETVSVHCGAMEFLENKTTFLFQNTTQCYFNKVLGRSVCINY
jgi:hypothetical protein